MNCESKKARNSYINRNKCHLRNCCVNPLPSAATTNLSMSTECDLTSERIEIEKINYLHKPYYAMQCDQIIAFVYNYIMLSTPYNSC